MVKKIIILLILAAVAVGIILYFQSQKEEAQPAPTPQPATGNIDDAVNALLAEITDEQLTLDDAADDGSLLFSDSQEVNAFNQSVDANEF